MNRPREKLSFPTPLENGGFLLWPAAHDISRDIAANITSLRQYSQSPQSPGILPLRRQARREILDAAGAFSRKLHLPVPPTGSPNTPLIVTGHQSGFFHGGILSKYILTDILAHTVQGRALNLIVDNDLPKNIFLALPTLENGKTIRKQIPVCSVQAHLPLEFQMPPDASQLQQFIAAVKSCNPVAVEQDRIDRLITAVRETQHLPVENLAQWFALLTHKLTRELGIQWLELPVSTMSQLACFGHFVDDLLSRAEEFRYYYNNALQSHRQLYNIRNPLQPVPDLAAGPEGWFEIPFWLVRYGQPRRRLFVKKDAQKIALADADKPLLDIPAFDSHPSQTDNRPPWLEMLQDCGFFIRPRALTLTIFVRLFCADYFIHGIGGAYYDQVADEIISSFYHITPPAFACSSATLLLVPSSRNDMQQAREKLLSLRRQIRDLQYNPQRYLPCATDLLLRRRVAIRLNRILRSKQAPRQQRRQVFELIRKINAEIMSQSPSLLQELRIREQTAQTELANAKILADREYCFCLIPAQELQSLKRDLAGQFSPCPVTRQIANYV